MPLAEWYLRPWGHSHSLPLNQELHIRLLIDPAGISGLKGIFGQELLLPYSLIETDTDDPVLLHLISLEGRVGWNGEGDFLAKLPIPLQTLWENPNERKLRIPISDAQIEAIEEARKGDRVNLAISFGGMAIFVARSEYAGITQSTYAKQVGTMVPIESATSGYLGIEREHWLQILSQLGAGTRRLVELPDPQLPRGVEQWAECLRLLDEATRFYRSGEYEQVLKNGRSIVEGIPHVLCRVWGLQEPVKGRPAFEGWLKEMESRLRREWTDDDLTPGMLQTMISGAWKWFAPAPHYGTRIPLREDASFSLGLCTDLLCFAGNVLRAHPNPIRQKDTINSANI